MARLSALEIYQVARAAGFTRDDAVTWTAIALAESGGNPRAHATGIEDSRGLWQINLDAHANKWGDLYDPLTNARAAFDVSHHGTTLRPWSVTHANNRGTPRDYRRYLDEAQDAAQRDPGGGWTGHAAAVSVATASNGAGADVTSLSFDGVDHQGPTCQPISDAKLADTFGAPRSGGRKHLGVDIFKPEGTPIHAIAGGTVVQGFDNSLGGKVVRIQGDDGRYYYYAHLKDHTMDHLKVGQHVNAGQVIGGVGHTGDAAGTPNHLHLQVRENGQWINPYEFLQGLPDIEDVVGTTPTGLPADPFAIDPGAPPSVADSDHDGLTDLFEALFGTDPNQADTDHDGLSDAYETGVSHTDPLSADTDHDGISDAVEVARGSDAGLAAVPAAVRAQQFGGLATLDSDHDGLSDLYEQRIGTDPMKADSDMDGLSDADEVARGSNPLSMDSDNDGLTDPFEAAAGTLEPSAPTGTSATGLPGPGQGAGLGAGVGADAAGGHLDDLLDDDPTT